MQSISTSVPCRRLQVTCNMTRLLRMHPEGLQASAREGLSPCNIGIGIGIGIAPGAYRFYRFLSIVYDHIVNPGG